MCRSVSGHCPALFRKHRADRHHPSFIVPLGITGKAAPALILKGVAGGHLASFALLGHRLNPHARPSAPHHPPTRWRSALRAPSPQPRNRIRASTSCRSGVRSGTATRVAPQPHPPTACGRPLPTICDLDLHFLTNPAIFVL